MKQTPLLWSQFFRLHALRLRHVMRCSRAAWCCHAIYITCVCDANAQSTAIAFSVNASLRGNIYRGHWCLRSFNLCVRLSNMLLEAAIRRWVHCGHNEMGIVGINTRMMLTCKVRYKENPSSMNLLPPAWNINKQDGPMLYISCKD